jgi:hypothetical protein
MFMSFMELWTVDTWRVRQGAERQFLALLSEHSVGGDSVFRDLDQPRTYWVPRRWESKSQLEEWHTSFANLSAELVEAVSTHVMSSVED